MKVKDYVRTHLDAFKSEDIDRMSKAIKEIHEGLIREANAKIRAYAMQSGASAKESYADSIIHQYNAKANALNRELERLLGRPTLKDDWFLRMTKKGLD